MDDIATDVGELQSCLLTLETEVSQLSRRQCRTREPETETLLAFCLQLRSFGARLFDIQTRLLQHVTNSIEDESEPECHPP